jgi:peroxiredoxin
MPLSRIAGRLRSRSLLPGALAVLLTLSLFSSLSLRHGHADSPIAESAEDVMPVAAGEAAPRFVVRRVDGERFDFDPRSLERPAILITFRGGWCPYCNMHLSELRHVVPEISEMDVDVYFLSGDRPDQLYASLSDEARDDAESLGYTILSDADANAAIALGIAFRTPSGMKARFDERGRDIEGSSIAKHSVLPVPAVFGVDTNGRVTFAYVIPDYKVRLPADELLDVARDLANEAP